ncbi:MAG: hypothetical protein NTNFB02_08380 [Nitrospira sp.]
MKDRARRACHMPRFWAVALGCMFTASTIFSSTTAFADEETPGEVESRGMPKIERPMQPGMSVAPGTLAQQKSQLPTWPQKWDVNNRELAGFGFGVTQAGPITVEVQSQGAPVVVSLSSGAPQPVQQQSGSGTIRLSYNVTPAEVQRSVLWQVRIALAQPGGPPAQAAGTITVQHPPADINVVHAQVQSLVTQRRAPDPQAEAAMKATLETSFQATLARFQQEQAARRAVIAAELQPQLQAARARMQGHVKPRGVEGESAPEQFKAPSEEDVASRGLLDRSQPLIAAPQGSQTFKAVLPPPYITWISRPNGQPGDELLITGDFFGQPAPGNQLTMVLLADPPNGGPVTFVANVKEWREGLIWFTIPDVSGILRGRQVDWTITRGSDGISSAQPQALPFQFHPAMELRRLPLPPPFDESFVFNPWNSNYPGSSGFATGIPSDGAPDGWKRCSSCGEDNWYIRKEYGGDLGAKGNDLFFTKKLLKNSWKVQSTEVVNAFADLYPYDPSLTGAGQYIVENRIGTNSPFVNVRTWQTPSTFVKYILRIWIVGPKGVPYE